MVKLDMITEKLTSVREEVDSRIDKTGSLYSRIKSIIGVIVMVLFRLRKVVLAIPVVYYALKLASYNMENLPEMVGVNLQSNGAFADLITRNAAVMGPLAVTAACLVLMFFSKKALYPWAVSIFSLILPLLIWFSNVYPA
ncbi:MAG: hypothetical protein IJ001_07050 [Oscillospiraceae bacterium]|nr:hypothetical protein [Oscillospiraceae bacterium]